MTPAKPKAPTRRVNQGTGHSYFIDDIKVPGVTTLLDGIPKNLTSWAAGTVAEFVLNRLEIIDGHVVADEVLDDLRADAKAAKRPETIPDWRGRKRLGALVSRFEWHMKGLPYRTRDEAAAKGTEVHGYAERLNAGEDVQVPTHLVGYVDAYLKFLADWAPVDVMAEVVVVSRTHRYMGTADIIAGGFANAPQYGAPIIDIKTGAKGPYETTGLQLAGYRFADAYLDDTGAEVPMPVLDSAWCLWLRQDGYDLIPFVAEEPELRVLLYAGQVKAFMEANNFKGDDPPGWVERRHFRRLKGEAVAPPKTTHTEEQTP